MGVVMFFFSASRVHNKDVVTVVTAVELYRHLRPYHVCCDSAKGAFPSCLTLFYLASVFVFSFFGGNLARALCLPFTAEPATAGFVPPCSPFSSWCNRHA